MKLVLVLDNGECHDVAEFVDCVASTQTLYKQPSDHPDGVDEIIATELMRDVILTVHQKVIEPKTKKVCHCIVKHANTAKERKRVEFDLTQARYRGDQMYVTQYVAQLNNKDCPAK